MKKIEELSGCNAITELYPYYRADVFASHLIETGYEMEQIIISRKDGRGHGFLHDINRVAVNYPNSNPESPYLEIESGRQGIYDSLPEDLFYSPDHTEKERDKAAIVRRFRANRQAESSVRRFLKLFEVETSQVLSFIQTKNLKYDKCYAYRESSDLFGAHWDIISLMSRSESQRFLRVVPCISRIRGNLPQMSAAISFILDVKTDIGYEYISTETAMQTPSLSEMYLEYNSVLHSGKDDVKDDSIVLVVSELELESCREFFEGQKYDKIIGFLVELFCDANTTFRIDIHPRSEYCHFMFGVVGNEPYLDVNTYL